MSQQKQKTQKKKRTKKTKEPNVPRSQAAPVAKTAPYVAAAPKMIQSPKTLRVVHREWVDNIVSTGGNGSAYLQYPLNPGIDQTFSWLSNIAINFERYKFRKLKFHYLTRSPSSSTGSMIIAPDYDAADSAPNDEMTAMSYANAKEDAIWKDIVVNCDLDSLNGGRKDHFVRTGPLSPNLDIKTYDCGNLWINNDSTIASGTVIGKLFVEYDVEFFNPQLPPSGDPLVASAAGSGGGNVLLAYPFGDTPANSVLNSLASMSYDSGTARNVLTMLEDAQTVLLTASGVGAGLTGLNNPTIRATPSPGVPRTVAVHNTPIVSSAATGALGTWAIQNLLRGDTIQMGTLTGSSATLGANWTMNRVTPTIV